MSAPQSCYQFVIFQLLPLMLFTFCSNKIVPTCFSSSLPSSSPSSSVLLLHAVVKPQWVSPSLLLRSSEFFANQLLLFVYVFTCVCLLVYLLLCLLSVFMFILLVFFVCLSRVACLFVRWQLGLKWQPSADHPKGRGVNRGDVRWELRWRQGVSWGRPLALLWHVLLTHTHRNNLAFISALDYLCGGSFINSSCVYSLGWCIMMTHVSSWLPWREERR